MTATLRLFPAYMRDLLPRVTILLVGSVLLLAPLLADLRSETGTRPAGVATAAWLTLIRPLIVLATLVLWTGIVAHERRQGTYRIVLARPLSRAGHYLTLLGARVVCLLIFTGTLATLLSCTARTPVLPALWGAVLAALTAGALVGSLTFAVSAFVDRGDALLVLALLLLHAALEGTADGSARGPPLAAILGGARILLSPLGAAGDVQEAVLAGSVFPWGAAALVAGCGLAALVAGLLQVARGDYERNPRRDR